MLGMTDGLLTDTEQRLLLVELDQVREGWGVGSDVLEQVIGLPSGTLTDGVAPCDLGCGCEAQLRRLLEVAHLAGLLVAPASARDWLRTPDPRLARGTPLEAMRRPGGLAFVRDMLRGEWDEATSMSRVHGGGV